MKPSLWVAVGVVAFTASAIILGVAARLKPPPASAAESFAEHPHELAPLWAAPPFSFPNQRGVTVSPATLSGQPYVANFIFTTCRTVCPLLTAKMVQVQRQLPDAPLRFVSFSVDPEHDTPAALAAYAQRWNPTEARWELLSTEANTLPALAAGFHVTASKNADSAALDPIMHSSVFVLVDAQGLVRGVYDSEHREDFQALVRDARTLAHDGAPAPRAERSGDELYHQLSCAGCHENNALAPSLHGLKGRQRELEASNLVVADHAYVVESILAPDSKRVRGFPLRMPTYDGLLTPAELDALADYVLSLPEEGANARADVGTAIDPICGMSVRMTPDALKLEADGGTVYFCSAHCRRVFETRR